MIKNSVYCLEVTSCLMFTKYFLSLIDTFFRQQLITTLKDVELRLYQFHSMKS